MIVIVILIIFVINREQQNIFPNQRFSNFSNSCHMDSFIFGLESCVWNSNDLILKKFGQNSKFANDNLNCDKLSTLSSIEDIFGLIFWLEKYSPTLREMNSRRNELRKHLTNYQINNYYIYQEWINIQSSILNWTYSLQSEYRLIGGFSPIMVTIEIYFECIVHKFLFDKSAFAQLAIWGPSSNYCSSIQEAIDLFFSPIIDKCPQCDKLCTKRKIINQFPYILLIPVPEELKPIISDSIVIFNITYQLISKIYRSNHHFITLSKNNFNNNWYLYNDLNQTITSNYSLDNCFQLNLCMYLQQ